MQYKYKFFHLFSLFIFLLSSVVHAEYYVATSGQGGNDSSGNGSLAAPWATITHALENVPDGSLILVRPGTYNGRIRILGNFTTGVTVRSQIPYQAKLRNNSTVITAYKQSSPVRNIRIEGFDIAHAGPGSSALVVHIDGGGDKSVTNISMVNNILHDSYNNDILKINNATTDILVEGNMFYNQTGSDEHIDINSVDTVTVRDNIFFNDFEGSGRSNGNNTSSYIVIKDSNGNSDSFVGSRNVRVQRNIFLNWQGSSGSNFILIGEDGKSFYEGFDITIENNLLLGNSLELMRASFGVKGGRDILFRNNTISGDLPSLAYAMRLNREGNNPANSNIQFYNNIWSDPTGTMGAESSSRPNDFSDTGAGDVLSFTLSNNLYWNGGSAIPVNGSETINYTDDPQAIVASPSLVTPTNPIIPRWNPNTGKFADDSTTIRGSFIKLAEQYCTLPSGSGAIGQGSSLNAPADDLLKMSRNSANIDIGACQHNSGTTGPGTGTPLGDAITSPYLLLLK
jgi:hypothetical protein